MGYPREMNGAEPPVVPMNVTTRDDIVDAIHAEAAGTGESCAFPGIGPAQHGQGRDAGSRVWNANEASKGSSCDLPRM